MVTITSESYFDYVQLALENSILLEKSYYDSLIELMTYEASYIENCLEMGQIVVEAIEAKEIEVTKKRNIIDRIFDAIEALFGTFKQKVVVLMDKNNQWLKANMSKISEDSMSAIGEVEMTPFWQRTASDISKDIDELVNSLLNRTKNDPEKYASMDDLTKIVRQKIGGKNDLATDVKNFLRTGKVGAVPKQVKITGSDLFKYYNEMGSYVLQYDKTVVPRLNRMMVNLKNTVKGIKRDFTTESFCFLENTLYENTELGLLPNFGIVLEAENGSAKTEDPQLKSGKIDDNPKNVTSVNATKTDDNNGKDNNSAKVSEYCKNLTNILKILHGSALTVFEEKYVTYMNLFKVVVANVDKKSKKKTDTKDEEE